MELDLYRKKDKMYYRIYSVQMIMGKGPLGQPAPVIVFLIFNSEAERWELIEADEFLPHKPEESDSVSEKAKTPILGG